MLEINYKVVDAAFKETTNEMDLRYSIFLGNVELKNSNKSILIDWEWVPILDFALCLLSVKNKLVHQVEVTEECDFTENDEKMVFQKQGNMIKISTSFSDEVLDCEVLSFETVVELFFKDVVFDMLDKNKELENNPIFQKYIKEAKSINL